MIIRPLIASIEEIEAVMAVDALTFKECPYTAAEFLKRLDFDSYPMMVAEERGEILGFISFMKVQTFHYSGLWIDLVAVKPSAANKGVGRSLIHAGEELSKELKVDFQSALIKEDNIGSIKAFESQGFERDKKPFRLYFK